MAFNRALDKRIEKQNMQKRKLGKDYGPEDMELEMERAPQLSLNKQKSVFDTEGGNCTPGINTAPSIFDKTAVFHVDT